MAKNFLKPGITNTFTAPAGGTTIGVPVLIGGVFVVPLDTVAATLPFEGDAEGIWFFTKPTGEVWAEGQAVFWDVANLRASTDPTVGLVMGSVAIAALTADLIGYVRLNGISLGGRVINVRKHLSVAAVNAGATLIPAMPGMKLRLIAISAIAVGGAAGAVTTVDVKATQATVAVKLVAFAQASLTQSTELKSGGAGAAILADGASYAPNDAGTAVTVGITGSAITTATFIDFIGTFALE